jgi:hypothetical protein
LERVKLQLFCGDDVEGDLGAILGVVGDELFAAETVADDDCGIDGVFNNDLGFAEVHEIATAYGHATAFGVDGGRFHIFLAPSDKMTTVERDVATAVQGRVMIGGGDTPEATCGKFHRAGIGFDYFNAGHELAIDERYASVILTALNAHGRRSDVGTTLCQETIPGAALALGKLITNFVADTKTVREKFPIGAAHDECNRLSTHEIVKRPFPPAPE